MPKHLRTTLKHLVTATLYCVLLSIPALAGAADKEKEPEQEGEKSYQLPSVVVTADKSSKDVQKTPIAMTVFTEQDLEDNNIKTIRDALARVPSLMQVEDIGGNTKLSFRGALSSTGTETSPLVMYIDGVPVDSYSFLDANLLNIERIEVLRGAQSSIYGKNAFGGVVNIISKKPDNELQGKAFADAGTEESYGFGGVVSGPIVEDKLFFSLAGSHAHSSGFMDHPNSSDSNLERNVRLKGQMRLLPTDESELNLHMDYTAKRDGFIPYALGKSASLESPAADSDYRDEDIVNMALHGAVDFEHLTFKSITTYRNDIMKSSLDTKPIYGPAVGGLSNYHDVSSEYTQELRLQSREDKENSFNWLAGLYGGYRDFDRKEFNLVMGGVEITDYPYQEKTLDFAPFAQVEIPLAEAFTLTGGLRWQYVKRNASLHYELFQVPQYEVNPSDSWSEWLPRLVLSYDISDEHMIYAGVNKSFLPGGYNRQNTVSTVKYTYDSQTAWNYELGAKTSWLDKRLNANLTLFYSKYKDMQVRQWDAIAVSTFAENAGAATAYGAELDLDMQISSELRAMAAVGYTHAKYDDFISKSFAGTDVDYSGKKVENTPNYTGNVSLVYRHGSGLMAQLGAQYAGKMYWAADNIDSRDPVITANAKVGYEAESFDVYLYSTNLFDERYANAYGGANLDIVIMAPPREVGLQFNYRW
ncbi:TonB-dependent receptor [Pseudodesulfovibrio alkaliphilus]|uniref:TonB-dependent receptor n=1 Tax=Pseudodesulfovibrio alkaliphilus TaxID=2661613 RepID=UPI0018C8A43B